MHGNVKNIFMYYLGKKINNFNNGDYIWKIYNIKVGAV